MHFAGQQQALGSLNGYLSKFLMQTRRKHVAPYLKHKQHILEIGCGIFGWTDFLHKDSYYVGIDCEETIIQYNNQHFPYQFFEADIEKNSNIRFDNNFDVILLIAVLEHFSDPDKVLNKLKPLLNKGGKVVLTTPHPAGDNILNVGAKFGFFADDKEEHQELLGYKAIESIAKLSGYKIVKYKRFLFYFNQLIVLESEY